MRSPRSRPGPAAWVGLLAATQEVLGWPGLLAAAVGLNLLIVVGLGSLRWVRRRMPYEHWHVFHLLTYVAVALGFSHQLAGPNLAGNRAVQIGWSLLYAYAFAMVVRYRLVQPLHQLWRHRLKVEEIVRESGDVVSIVMSGGHLDELQAEAGQFFRWRFLTRTTWSASYPFSLSAPPTNDRLRITIKAVGLGTRLLHDLHPGTVVLAEGPYGALTERRRRRRRVLLVAGGVGITPMRVLFETLDLPGEDLTLVYRAPNEEAVVFREELDAIAARKGARVLYLIGASDEPENLLNAYTLRAMVGPLQEYDIYLCAPPRMAGRLRESLLHTGHSRRQLHEEQFTFDERAVDQHHGLTTGTGTRASWPDAILSAGPARGRRRTEARRSPPGPSGWRTCSASAGLAGRGDAVDAHAERSVTGMRGQQVVDHPVEDQTARRAGHLDHDTADRGLCPGHSNQT